MFNKRTLLCVIGLCCFVTAGHLYYFFNDSKILAEVTSPSQTVEPEAKYQINLESNTKIRNQKETTESLAEKVDEKMMDEAAQHLEQWAKKNAHLFNQLESDPSKPKGEPWPLKEEALDPYEGLVPSGESDELKADENNNGLWDQPELIIIKSVGADRRTTEALLGRLLNMQKEAENGIYWTDDQMENYIVESQKAIHCSVKAWINSPFKGDGVNIIMKNVHDVTFGTPQGIASYDAVTNYFTGKRFPRTPRMSLKECDVLLQEMGVTR